MTDDIGAETHNMLIHIIASQCKLVTIDCLKNISAIMASDICYYRESGIVAPITEVSTAENDVSQHAHIKQDKQKDRKEILQRTIKIDGTEFESLSDVANHYKIAYSQLYYRVVKQSQEVEKAVKFLTTTKGKI